MTSSSATARRILIDISTSARWRGANAVGIVRTEREIARHLLTHVANATAIRFDGARRAFIAIPRPDALGILGVEPDPAPRRLFAGRPPAEAPLSFRDGDVLISAGLSWDDDFLSIVYEAKAERDIGFVQVVYDIVPLVMPEYAAPGMEKKFATFILDTAWTADLVYAISEATARDLRRYCASIDLACPPVRRLHLGVDLARGGPEAAPVPDLETGGFVLYVSTIEPRKNHQLLFNLWRDLHANDRQALVPIVFVGKRGWAMDDFVTCVERSSALFPRFVRFLHDVSDRQLDWLYEQCLFTVYPSLHEGWGLPVAESLSRGKVCICAWNSSLGEAGGLHADFVDTFDFQGWRTAVLTYLADGDALSRREAEIRSGFEGLDWEAAMGLFGADLAGWLEETGSGRGRTRS